MNVQRLAGALPSQPTRFIGRENDLARITAMLADSSCQMVTLVGPGGIGKTRLATEVGLRVQEHFDHGVYFFNLQPVSTAAMLAATLADGLKMTLHDDPLAQTLYYLQDKACLLILDNFEHLLDGANVLAAILDGAPQTKLLVTSREVLNLRQEWVWPVTGMAFPDSEHSETAQNYSAVRLFLECAQRVRPDFSLADAQADVIRICRLVQGMPLAIELAATWLKLLTCAEIAVEIQRSLDFLNTNLRNVPERHRSIRAVFDQSWKLLSPAEQAVFRRLSVFRGGFLREAAEQVAGATLATLSALVDKSLIWRDENGRYQMHDLLRQYGEERLNEDTEEVQRVHDAHTMYYADFLHHREQDVTGPRQREAFREISAELDNIRAAWQHTLRQADTTMIQKAAYTLFEFCDLHGHYAECANLFESAIQRLDAAEANRQRDLALATLHVLAGWEYIRLGRFEEARAAFQTNLAMYHDLDTQPQPGFGTEALSGLALLAVVSGEYAKAVTLGEEARRRSEGRADKLNLQIALYVLASATYSQEQYETALYHARQAYRLSEELGNLFFSAHLLGVMGNIVWALEDLDQAWEYYQTSYALKQELDDIGSMAFALNGMGGIAWIRQDYAEAARLYQQGHDFYRQVNDPGGYGMSLFGLGDTAQAQGNYETAQTYFQEALEVAARIRWPQLMLTILVGVGDMLLRTGERDEAEEALALAAQHPATEPAARRRAKQLLRTVSDLPAMADLDSTVAAVREWLTRPRKNAPIRQDGLFESLSARELEILRLLSEGLTNEEIAERLTLVVGTVKAHNHHIFGKLGVKNRVQAIARARALGMV